MIPLRLQLRLRKCCFQFPWERCLWIFVVAWFFAILVLLLYALLAFGSTQGTTSPCVGDRVDFENQIYLPACLQRFPGANASACRQAWRLGHDVSHLYVCE